MEQSFAVHYYSTIRTGLRIVPLLLAALSLAYAGRDYLDTRSVFLATRTNGTPAVFYLFLLGMSFWPGFGRIWMLTAAAFGIAAAAISLNGLGGFTASIPPQTVGGATSVFFGRQIFTLQTCILMICFAAFRLPFR